MKRTKMNEMLLRGFLNNDGIASNGYKASFNGEEYFKLQNDTLYGPKCLFLRTDMGYSVHQVNDNNIEELANKIQQTLIDLDNIVERSNSIAEYLTSDEGKWGRSSLVKGIDLC